MTAFVVACVVILFVYVLLKIVAGLLDIAGIGPGASVNDCVDGLVHVGVDRSTAVIRCE